MSQILLKSVFFLVGLSLLWGALPTQAGPALNDARAVTSLDDYLLWADQNHPRLSGAAARAEVATQTVAEAGALPDLKLAWGEMIVPVETRVGPQQRILSVSQSLPWFGTLGEKESAADFQAQAAGSRLQAEKLFVRRQVLGAWIELARLQEEILLTNEHADLSQQAEEVALRNYEAGQAPLRHVLQAQMSLDRLAIEQASLADRLVSATVILNTLAALPADKITPEARLIITPIPEFTTEMALTALVKNNPDLQGLRLQEESYRHGLEAARLSGRPGFTLGVDYIMTGPAAMDGVVDSGKDPVIARLAVNVPLWSGKATARRLASASRLQAAVSDQGRRQLDLEKQLEQGLFRVRDARRRLNLHLEKLLPRSRQVLKAAFKDYEGGRATFDEVITAQEYLLELERVQLQITADQILAVADLETLLGMPLENISTSEGGS